MKTYKEIESIVNEIKEAKAKAIMYFEKAKETESIEEHCEYIALCESQMDICTRLSKQIENIDEEYLKENFSFDFFDTTLIFNYLN